MNVWSKIIVGSAAVGCLLIAYKIKKLGTKNAMGNGSLWSRPVGRTQEIFNYITGKHAMWNVANVQTIVTKKPLMKHQLHTALLRAASYHPLLTACFMRDLENSSLQFEEITDFDIHIFESSEEGNWLLLFEKFLSEVYEDNCPLWKVGYCASIPPTFIDDEFPYEYNIVFGFHHSVTDGTACVQFCREVLWCLEEIFSGEKSPTHDVLCKTEDMPLEETIPGLEKTIYDIIREKVIYSMIKMPFGMNILRKYFIRDVENKWVDKFGIELERNPSAEEKTTILCKFLTEEETSKLSAACKKNGVTIHSVLQTVSNIAVATMLQDGKITVPQNCDYAAPVSLRRYIPERYNKYMFSSYFANFHDTLTILPSWVDNFWELVSSQQSVLSEFLMNGYIPQMRMKRLFPVLAETNLSVYNNLTPGLRDKNLFIISNMGNCNYVNDNLTMVKLASRYSAFSYHKTGPTFCSTICTVNNRLFWGITYCPHIISKQTAERIWITIRGILDEKVLA